MRILSRSVATWAAGCAAAALVLPGVAGAADANSFRLGGARSLGGMLLPGAQVLAPSSWDLSLSFSHEEGVLSTQVPTGTIRGGGRWQDATWIDSRDLLFLQFAISPIERLEIVGGVPVLLAQGTGAVGELEAPRADGGTLGDPRLGVRYAIFGDAASRWIGSVQGGLALPGGGSDYAMGNDGARADLALSAGYQEPGVWSALLHVGHRMGERAVVGDQLLGDTLVAGAGFFLHEEVAGHALQYGLEAVLQSAVAPVDEGNPDRTALEILGGARYFLPFVYVDLGAGVAAAAAGATPDWRVIASVGTTGSWARSAPPAPPPPPQQVVVNVQANGAPQEPPTVDPTVVEKAVRVAELERHSVLFETGSIVLDESARRTLGAVALLLHRTEGRVRIHGYADDRGTHERNLQLSQQRAEVVRDALIEAGIAPERLEIHALGDGAPVGPSTEMGRAINRRATLHWVD